MSVSNIPGIGLLEEIDCRTPGILFSDEVALGDTKKFVETISDVGPGAFLEYFRVEFDEDILRGKKKIQATLGDGDWLLIDFRPGVDYVEFLRWAGRELMTMMPSVATHPNMELFRLWMAFPTRSEFLRLCPALLTHIAVIVPAGFVPAFATVKRRGSNFSVSDEEEHPEHADSTFSKKKLGPLFYRRSELQSGTVPQSTKQCVKAQLRAQSAAAIRKLSKGSYNSSQNLPAGTISNSAIRPQSCFPRPAVPVPPVNKQEEQEFESAAAKASQDIMSGLLKAWVWDHDEATRLLRFAQKVGSNLSGSSAASTLPTCAPSALVLESLQYRLSYSTGQRTHEIQVRRAQWYSTPVNVERYDRNAFEAVASLLELRFHRRHPKLLGLTTTVREGDYIYVVCDLPVFEAVFQRVRHQKAVSMMYVASLAIGVLEALSFLHAEGIVHRDLMAQHVVECEDQSFKLRLTPRAQLVDANGYAGNTDIPVRWSSPEALSTAFYTTSDDIWGFGCMMWEVLTKCQEAPFASTTEKTDVMAGICEGTLRLRIPPQCSTVMWDRLVAPCFATRQYRPTATQLLENAKEYMATLQR